MIKGIPISSRLPPDKMIWAVTPNGKYSVMSAYSIAMRLTNCVDQGASSNQSHTCWFWKKIWDLPLPHKVRHFAWRACRDILPTKVNLMCWKVVHDQVYEGCRLEAEITRHLFYWCAQELERYGPVRILLCQKTKIEVYRSMTCYGLCWLKKDKMSRW